MLLHKNDVVLVSTCQSTLQNNIKHITNVVVVFSNALVTAGTSFQHNVSHIATASYNPMLKPQPVPVLCKQLQKVSPVYLLHALKDTFDKTNPAGQ